MYAFDGSRLIQTVEEALVSFSLLDFLIVVGNQIGHSSSDPSFCHHFNVGSVVHSFWIVTTLMAAACHCHRRTSHYLASFPEHHPRRLSHYHCYHH
jgi:hypothetical protein